MGKCSSKERRGRKLVNEKGNKGPQPSVSSSASSSPTASQAQASALTAPVQATSLPRGSEATQAVPTPTVSPANKRKAKKSRAQPVAIATKVEDPVEATTSQSLEEPDLFFGEEVQAVASSSAPAGLRRRNVPAKKETTPPENMPSDVYYDNFPTDVRSESFHDAIDDLPEFPVLDSSFDESEFRTPIGRLSTDSNASSEKSSSFSEKERAVTSHYGFSPKTKESLASTKQGTKEQARPRQQFEIVRSITEDKPRDIQHATDESSVQLQAFSVTESQPLRRETITSQMGNVLPIHTREEHFAAPTLPTPLISHDNLVAQAKQPPIEAEKSGPLLQDVELPHATDSGDASPTESFEHIEASDAYFSEDDMHPRKSDSSYVMLGSEKAEQASQDVSPSSSLDDVMVEQTEGFGSHPDIREEPSKQPEAGYNTTSRGDVTHKTSFPQHEQTPSTSLPKQEEKQMDYHTSQLPAQSLKLAPAKPMIEAYQLAEDKVEQLVEPKPIKAAEEADAATNKTLVDQHASTKDFEREDDNQTCEARDTKSDMVQKLDTKDVSLPEYESGIGGNNKVQELDLTNLGIHVGLLDTEPEKSTLEQGPASYQLPRERIKLVDKEPPPDLVVDGPKQKPQNLECHTVATNEDDTRPLIEDQTIDKKMDKDDTQKIMELGVPYISEDGKQKPDLQNVPTTISEERELDVSKMGTQEVLQNDGLQELEAATIEREQCGSQLPSGGGQPKDDKQPTSPMDEQKSELVEPKPIAVGDWAGESGTVDHNKQKFRRDSTSIENSQEPFQKLVAKDVSIKHEEESQESSSKEIDQTLRPDKHITDRKEHDASVMLHSKQQENPEEELSPTIEESLPCIDGNAQEDEKQVQELASELAHIPTPEQGDTVQKEAEDNMARELDVSTRIKEGLQNVQEPDITAFVESEESQQIEKEQPATVVDERKEEELDELGRSQVADKVTAVGDWIEASTTRSLIDKQLSSNEDQLQGDAEKAEAVYKNVPEQEDKAQEERGPKEPSQSDKISADGPKDNLPELEVAEKSQQAHEDEYSPTTEAQEESCINPENQEDDKEIASIPIEKPGTALAPKHEDSLKQEKFTEDNEVQEPNLTASLQETLPNVKVRQPEDSTLAQEQNSYQAQTDADGQSINEVQETRHEKEAQASRSFQLPIEESNIVDEEELTRTLKQEPQDLKHTALVDETSAETQPTTVVDEKKEEELEELNSRPLAHETNAAVSESLIEEQAAIYLNKPTDYARAFEDTDSLHHKEAEVQSTGVEDVQIDGGKVLKKKEPEEPDETVDQSCNSCVSELRDNSQGLEVIGVGLKQQDSSLPPEEVETCADREGYMDELEADLDNIGTAPEIPQEKAVDQELIGDEQQEKVQEELRKTETQQGDEQKESTSREEEGTDIHKERELVLTEMPSEEVLQKDIEETKPVIEVEQAIQSEESQPVDEQPGRGVAVQKEEEPEVLKPLPLSDEADAEVTGLQIEEPTTINQDKQEEDTQMPEASSVSHQRDFSVESLGIPDVLNEEEKGTTESISEAPDETVIQSDIIDADKHEDGLQKLEVRNEAVKPAQDAHGEVSISASEDNEEPCTDAENQDIPKHEVEAAQDLLGASNEVSNLQKEDAVQEQEVDKVQERDSAKLTIPEGLHGEHEPAQSSEEFEQPGHPLECAESQLVEKEQQTREVDEKLVEGLTPIPAADKDDGTTVNQNEQDVNARNLEASQLSHQQETNMEIPGIDNVPIKEKENLPEQNNALSDTTEHKDDIPEPQAKEMVEQEAHKEDFIPTSEDQDEKEHHKQELEGTNDSFEKIPGSRYEDGVVKEQSTQALDTTNIVEEGLQSDEVQEPEHTSTFEVDQPSYQSQKEGSQPEVAAEQPASVEELGKDEMKPTTVVCEAEGATSQNEDMSRDHIDEQEEKVLEEPDQTVIESGTSYLDETKHDLDDIETVELLKEGDEDASSHKADAKTVSCIEVDGIAQAAVPELEKEDEDQEQQSTRDHEEDQEQQSTRDHENDVIKSTIPDKLEDANVQEPREEILEQEQRSYQLQKEGSIPKDEEQQKGAQEDKYEQPSMVADEAAALNEQHEENEVDAAVPESLTKEREFREPCEVDDADTTLIEPLLERQISAPNKNVYPEEPEATEVEQEERNLQLQSERSIPEDEQQHLDDQEDKQQQPIEAVQQDEDEQVKPCKVSLPDEINAGATAATTESFIEEQAEIDNKELCGVAGATDKESMLEAQEPCEVSLPDEVDTAATAATTESFIEEQAAIDNKELYDQESMLEEPLGSKDNNVQEPEAAIEEQVQSEGGTHRDGEQLMYQHEDSHQKPSEDVAKVEARDDQDDKDDHLKQSELAVQVNAVTMESSIERKASIGGKEQCDLPDTVDTATTESLYEDHASLESQDANVQEPEVEISKQSSHLGSTPEDEPHINEEDDKYEEPSVLVNEADGFNEQKDKHGQLVPSEKPDEIHAASTSLTEEDAPIDRTELCKEADETTSLEAQAPLHSKETYVQEHQAAMLRPEQRSYQLQSEENIPRDEDKQEDKDEKLKPSTIADEGDKDKELKRCEVPDEVDAVATEFEEQPSTDSKEPCVKADEFLEDQAPIDSNDAYGQEPGVDKHEQFNPCEFADEVDTATAESEIEEQASMETKEPCVVPDDADEATTVALLEEQAPIDSKDVCVQTPEEDKYKLLKPCDVKDEDDAAATESLTEEQTFQEHEKSLTVADEADEAATKSLLEEQAPKDSSDIYTQLKPREVEDDIYTQLKPEDEVDAATTEFKVEEQTSKDAEEPCVLPCGVDEATTQSLLEEEVPMHSKDTVQEPEEKISKQQEEQTLEQEQEDKPEPFEIEDATTAKFMIEEQTSKGTKEPCVLADDVDKATTETLPKEQAPIDSKDAVQEPAEKISEQEQKTYLHQSEESIPGDGQPINAEDEQKDKQHLFAPVESKDSNVQETQEASVLQEQRSDQHQIERNLPEDDQPTSAVDGEEDKHEPSAVEDEATTLIGEEDKNGHLRRTEVADEVASATTEPLIAGQVSTESKEQCELVPETNSLEKEVMNVAVDLHQEASDRESGLAADGNEVQESALQEEMQNPEEMAETQAPQLQNEEDKLVEEEQPANAELDDQKQEFEDLHITNKADEVGEALADSSTGEKELIDLTKPQETEENLDTKDDSTVRADQEKKALEEPHLEELCESGPTAADEVKPCIDADEQENDKLDQDMSLEDIGQIPELEQKDTLKEPEVTADSNEMRELDPAELVIQEGPRREEVQKPEGIDEINQDMIDLELSTKENKADAFNTESSIEGQETIDNIWSKETEEDSQVKNDLKDQKDEQEEKALEKAHQEEPCELEPALGAQHEVKPCTDADDQKIGMLEAADVSLEDLEKIPKLEPEDSVKEPEVADVRELDVAELAPQSEKIPQLEKEDCVLKPEVTDDNEVLELDVAELGIQDGIQNEEVQKQEELAEEAKAQEPQLQEEENVLVNEQQTAGKLDDQAQELKDLELTTNADEDDAAIAEYTIAEQESINHIKPRETEKDFDTKNNLTDQGDDQLEKVSEEPHEEPPYEGQSGLAAEDEVKPCMDTEDRKSDTLNLEVVDGSEVEQECEKTEPDVTDGNKVEKLDVVELAVQEAVQNEGVPKSEEMAEAQAPRSYQLQDEEFVPKDEQHNQHLDLTTQADEADAATSESKLREQESIDHIKPRDTLEYYNDKDDSIDQGDEQEEKASEEPHQEEACEGESSLEAQDEVKPCTDADDQKNDRLHLDVAELKQEDGMKEPEVTVGSEARELDVANLVVQEGFQNEEVHKPEEMAEDQAPRIYPLQDEDNAPMEEGNPDSEVNEPKEELRDEVDGAKADEADATITESRIERQESIDRTEHTDTLEDFDVKDDSTEEGDKQKERALEEPHQTVCESSTTSADTNEVEPQKEGHEGEASPTLEELKANVRAEEDRKRMDCPEEEDIVCQPVTADTDLKKLDDRRLQEIEVAHQEACKGESSLTFQDKEEPQVEALKLEQEDLEDKQDVTKDDKPLGLELAKVTPKGEPQSDEMHEPEGISLEQEQRGSQLQTEESKFEDEKHLNRVTNEQVQVHEYLHEDQDKHKQLKPCGEVSVSDEADAATTATTAESFIEEQAIENKEPGGVADDTDLETTESLLEAQEPLDSKDGNVQEPDAAILEQEQSRYQLQKEGSIHRDGEQHVDKQEDNDEKPLAVADKVDALDEQDDNDEQLKQYEVTKETDAASMECSIDDIESKESCDLADNTDIANTESLHEDHASLESKDANGQEPGVAILEQEQRSSQLVSSPGDEQHLNKQEDKIEKPSVVANEADGADEQEDKYEQLVASEKPDEIHTAPTESLTEEHASIDSTELRGMQDDTDAATSLEAQAPLDSKEAYVQEHQPAMLEHEQRSYQFQSEGNITRDNEPLVDEQEDKDEKEKPSEIVDEANGLDYQGDKDEELELCKVADEVDAATTESLVEEQALKDSKQPSVEADETDGGLTKPLLEDQAPIDSRDAYLQEPEEDKHEQLKPCEVADEVDAATTESLIEQASEEPSVVADETDEATKETLLAEQAPIGSKDICVQKLEDDTYEHKPCDVQDEVNAPATASLADQQTLEETEEPLVGTDEADESTTKPLLEEHTPIDSNDAQEPEEDKYEQLTECSATTELLTDEQTSQVPKEPCVLEDDVDKTTTENLLEEQAPIHSKDAVQEPEETISEQQDEKTISEQEQEEKSEEPKPCEAEDHFDAATTEFMIGEHTSKETKEPHVFTDKVDEATKETLLDEHAQIDGKDAVQESEETISDQEQKTYLHQSKESIPGDGQPISAEDEQEGKQPSLAEQAPVESKDSDVQETKAECFSQEQQSSQHQSERIIPEDDHPTSAVDGEEDKHEMLESSAVADKVEALIGEDKHEQLKPSEEADEVASATTEYSAAEQASTESKEPYEKAKENDFLEKELMNVAIDPHQEASEQESGLAAEVQELAKIALPEEVENPEEIAKIQAPTSYQLQNEADALVEEEQTVNAGLDDQKQELEDLHITDEVDEPVTDSLTGEKEPIDLINPQETEENLDTKAGRGDEQEKKALEEPRQEEICEGGSGPAAEVEVKPCNDADEQKNDEFEQESANMSLEDLGQIPELEQKDNVQKPEVTADSSAVRELDTAELAIQEGTHHEEVQKLGGGAQHEEKPCTDADDQKYDMLDPEVADVSYEGLEKVPKLEQEDSVKEPEVVDGNEVPEHDIAELAEPDDCVLKPEVTDGNEVPELDVAELAIQDKVQNEQMQKPEEMAEAQAPQDYQLQEENVLVNEQQTASKVDEQEQELKDLELVTKADEADSAIAEYTIEEHESINHIKPRETEKDFDTTDNSTDQGDVQVEKGSEEPHEEQPYEGESGLAAEDEGKPCMATKDQKSGALNLEVVNISEDDKKPAPEVTDGIEVRELDVTEVAVQEAVQNEEEPKSEEMAEAQAPRSYQLPDDEFVHVDEHSVTEPVVTDDNKVQELRGTELAVHEGVQDEEAHKPEEMAEANPPGSYQLEDEKKLFVDEQQTASELDHKQEVKDLDLTPQANEADVDIAETRLRERESINHIKPKGTLEDFDGKDDSIDQGDEQEEKASEESHQEEACKGESSLAAQDEVEPCTDADDQKNYKLDLDVAELKQEDGLEQQELALINEAWELDAAEPLVQEKMSEAPAPSSYQLHREENAPMEDEKPDSEVNEQKEELKDEVDGAKADEADAVITESRTEERQESIDHIEHTDTVEDFDVEDDLTEEGDRQKEKALEEPHQTVSESSTTNADTHIDGEVEPQKDGHEGEASPMLEEDVLPCIDAIPEEVETVSKSIIVDADTNKGLEQESYELHSEQSKPADGEQLVNTVDKPQQEELEELKSMVVEDEADAATTTPAKQDQSSYQLQSESSEPAAEEQLAPEIEEQSQELKEPKPILEDDEVDAVPKPILEDGEVDKVAIEAKASDHETKQDNAQLQKHAEALGKQEEESYEVHIEESTPTGEEQLVNAVDEPEKELVELKPAVIEDEAHGATMNEKCASIQDRKQEDDSHLKEPKATPVEQDQRSFQLQSEVGEPAANQEQLVPEVFMAEEADVAATWSSLEQQASSKDLKQERDIQDLRVTDIPCPPEDMEQTPDVAQVSTGEGDEEKKKTVPEKHGSAVNKSQISANEHKDDVEDLEGIGMEEKHEEGQEQEFNTTPVPWTKADDLKNDGLVRTESTDEHEEEIMDASTSPSEQEDQAESAIEKLPHHPTDTLQVHDVLLEGGVRKGRVNEELAKASDGPSTFSADGYKDELQELKATHIGKPYPQAYEEADAKSEVRAEPCIEADGSQQELKIPNDQIYGLDKAPHLQRDHGIGEEEVSQEEDAKPLTAQEGLQNDELQQPKETTQLSYQLNNRRSEEQLPNAMDEQKQEFQNLELTVGAAEVDAHTIVADAAFPESLAEQQASIAVK